MLFKYGILIYNLGKLLMLIAAITYGMLTMCKALIVISGWLFLFYSISKPIK